MNFERFVAYRISASSEKRFASLIIRLAVATIALSIVVMIVTTSVIKGFKNEISSKVFNFWGHIHVTDGNSMNTFELIPINDNPLFTDSLERIEQVHYRLRDFFQEESDQGTMETSRGGITSVEKFIIVPGIVSSRSNFEGLLLKGLDRDYDLNKISPFMKDGDFIRYQDSIASRDLVISEQTAQRMGFEVGQAVIVHFIIDGEQYKRRFTISGVYRTGLEEYDRRFALVDMKILQEVLRWDDKKISGFEIYIEDLNDLELINDYIYYEELIGDRSHLASQSIRSKFFQIFEWLDLQDINETIIFLLMVIVATINMITALLIFVLERTQMIGMLKALGATNWSIRKIFLYNAGTILVKGLIIGNVLAIGICLLQKYTGLMTLREEDYYLSVVPIEFNIPTMVFINIGTLIITLAFLILPSALITKITPVKAVHFQ